MSTPVAVSNFKSTAYDIKDPATLNLIKLLYGIPKLPIVPIEASIEIKGIPTELINALRRVLTEMKGVRLHATKMDTTAELAFEEFIFSRIHCVRLVQKLTSDSKGGIQFSLDVTNNTPVPMKVYTGDFKLSGGKLTAPIFNPTIQIAELPPGAYIRIPNITIEKGFGKDHATFAACCSCRYTHLDIPQYTLDEINNGISSEYSGYKVSSMVANPRHHRLTILLPATTGEPSEALWMLVDGCDSLVSRFRSIHNVISQSDGKSNTSHMGITYIQSNTDAISEGTVNVINETYTVSGPICKTIFNMYPNVASVTHTMDNYTNTLTIKVAHATENITKIITDAIQHIIATFESIRQQIYDMIPS